MSRHIDVNCEHYELKAGAIGHGHDGYVFRCTIQPVSDDVLQRWDKVAQLKGTIRLVFPEQPLLLERIAVERIEPGCVRIVGRVVDGKTSKGLLP